MADGDSIENLPPLVDDSRLGFHESSTNVSIAATVGSESVQDWVSNVSDVDSSSEGSSSESDLEESESNIETGVPVENDSSDEEDWVEQANEEDNQPVKCIFCAENLSTANAVLEHCKNTHHFDLKLLKQRHRMDYYSYIRLINFIRSCNPTSQEVMEIDVPVWEDDKFMVPSLADDQMLMYDFETEEALPGTPSQGPEAWNASESSVSPFPEMMKPIMGSGVLVANAEGGHVTLTQSHFDHLQNSLHQLHLKLKERDAVIQQCRKDMHSMKKTMRNLVLSDKDFPRPTEARSLDEPADEEQDDYYFSSYAHFSIHHEMLSDRPRTEGYRDAIIKNADLVKDKVVLDLGCGTAILSMFSAKAGASSVIGVDQSQIIYNAMAIIRENKLEEKVKLIRGRIEDITLPSPVVDIIVSEWMGYFLLYEGMLDSVILARDRYLAPGGIMLPTTCSIAMMGVSDPKRYGEVVTFWDDVYGFQMTSMKPEVLREASVEVVPSDRIISSPETVLLLDLRTCTVQDTEFRADFNLKMTASGQLTAVCGSFDTDFLLPSKVVLTTSPFAPPTHWKQTVFYLPQPITVVKGQELPCKIEVRRHRRENRWLEINLEVNGTPLKYGIS